MLIYYFIASVSFIFGFILSSILAINGKSDDSSRLNELIDRCDELTEQINGPGK